MTKVIYDVFDSKTRTVTTVDFSNPELIISHKDWSELTREEKQRIKKTLKDTPSIPSNGSETRKSRA